MTSKPGSKMEIECAVCLQPSIHPVRLPCNHIFCFLCVKGTILRYDTYIFDILRVQTTSCRNSAFHIKSNYLAF